MERDGISPPTGGLYQEFIRSKHLSVGVYRLEPGSQDLQQPHAEDELYYVIAGRARFTSGDSTVDAIAGQCLFVPAGEPHRFRDIAERLELLVVFGPAESSYQDQTPSQSSVSEVAPDISRSFVDESRSLLTVSHFPRIERCLEGLADDKVWWRPNAESNSIGNLTLHLAGNVRQWIISGIGGATDNRQRQQEFDEKGPVPASELLSRLRTTVEEADRVLAGVTPATLLERREIQGCDVTVLEAIYHVVEHFSMHTGQIILLAKMWKGDLGFYNVSDGVVRPAWIDARMRRHLTHAQIQMARELGMNPAKLGKLDNHDQEPWKSGREGDLTSCLSEPVALLSSVGYREALPGPQFHSPQVANCGAQKLRELRGRR